MGPHARPRRAPRPRIGLVERVCLFPRERARSSSANVDRGVGPIQVRVEDSGLRRAPSPRQTPVSETPMHSAMLEAPKVTERFMPQRESSRLEK
jgi:hypothetical protein